MKSSLIVCILFLTIANGQDQVQPNSKLVLKAIEIELKEASCSRRSMCSLHLEMAALDKRKSRYYVSLIYADPVDGRDRLTMDAERQGDLSRNQVTRINNDDMVSLEFKIFDLRGGVNGTTIALGNETIEISRSALLSATSEVRTQSIKCVESDKCKEAIVKFQIFITAP